VHLVSNFHIAQPAAQDPLALTAAARDRKSACFSVRVLGELLNVLEGHVLIEKIGHDQDPEAVRGAGQPPEQIQPSSHQRTVEIAPSMVLAGFAEVDLPSLLHALQVKRS
jgi:hypothetical protein